MLRAATLALCLVVFGTVAQAADDRIVGGVYAMTNALDGNEVVAFDRRADGTLVAAGQFATGGLGGFAGSPVDALGAQDALISSPDRRWLFAVNAGSDTITVFRVKGSRLKRTDIEPSRGAFPVSMALDDDRLYVLNAGGDGSIVGFHFDDVRGRLERIRGAKRSLGAGGSNPPFFVDSPARIGFTPDGEFLVVTIKSLNQIVAFAIDDRDRPSRTPTVSDSAGTTPFSFDFDRRGRIVVAEVFGRGAVGDPAAGAVSSYEIAENGRLRLISRSVENRQTLTCWVALDRRGRFAFTSNNGSSTLSAYRVGRDGSLKLRGDGVAAAVDANPVDLDLTRDGRYLYVLNAFTGTIAGFQVDRRSGGLTAIDTIGGLPANQGAVGLVVH